MKANTDFGNLRIFDVIPFYEEYDIEKMIFHFCDANHGYILFQINGVTPDKLPYAATRVFTTKDCARLAKLIQKLNRHDHSIEGTREIVFVNFGNLL